MPEPQPPADPPVPHRPAEDQAAEHRAAEDPPVPYPPAENRAAEHRAAEHPPVPYPPAGAAPPAPPAGEPVEPALEACVRELERHVSRGGWDGPVRLFALIRTAQALGRDPSLREQLPPDLLASADADGSHLTSVEQEELPGADSLERLLAGVAWPDTVDGAAIAVERIVVPPEAERDLPADDAAATQALLDHPAREDVRMVVAVLRDGGSCCALRTRRHDDDLAVATGAELVPGLVQALRLTFAPAPG